MNLDDFRILSKDCAKLFVADYGVSAVVKICGRATFVSSVHFKKLFNNLIRQGCEKFTLDLSDCQLMDSTFLGVLVGLSRNFSNSADSIFLFNPSDQVNDMFDNLGILNFFGSINDLGLKTDFDSVSCNENLTDKTELTRNSLDAHQALMGVNMENKIKFKEVALYLEKKINSSGSS